MTGTENTYALIRVSTEDQNEARQVVAMTRLGIAKKNIVIEKESGKSGTRTKYQKLAKSLQEGDTLYIENIDRLSRDYDGIIGEWNKLTQKGVTVKVLDTPILNTDQAKDELMLRFVRNILLHIVAFQAENEWQKIKNRQAQGIAVAKANGKSLGRPKSPLTTRELFIVNLWKEKEISTPEAMERLGKKKTAFYNLCRNAVVKR